MEAMEEDTIRYLRKVWSTVGGAVTIAGGGVLASVALNTAAMGLVAITLFPVLILTRIVEAL